MLVEDFIEREGDTMKRSVFALTLLGAAALTVPAIAQEYRMLSSFPEGFVYNTEAGNPFVELVREESNGALQIAMTYSDAVPQLEQLEPVQAGVFDLLFTHPAYHAGASTLGLAVDGIKSDPATRRASGVIDFLDAHYQEMGLKVIAVPPVGGSKGAFSIYLKEPITGTPSLAGRKIRGTITYHPLLEALGGSGVVLGAGDVYSSLQKGVIDGAAFSLGAPQLRWFEVADYVAQPRFGEVSGLVLMNLASWNSLTDDQKLVFERAAVRLELDAVGRFDAIYDAELETLQAEGMKTTVFPAEEAARLNSLLSGGVWDLAAKGDPAKAEKFRALATSSALID
jgi:TRAP-type C4-dicarboxylate transport system substrate-binding protein